jgi:Protein of unknown function (DUF1761)
MSEQPRVRQNYWAIVVAAIANFLLEAAWYNIFIQAWMNGIGRTEQELMGPGSLPMYLKFATALVSAAVMAAAISCVTQLTGPQTAWRGMRVGTALWMGFVITTWATEYVFEVRPFSLLAINAGFWFIGMNLMGMIVGGWKKKGVATATTQESRTAVGVQ